ncbi:MAG: ABC transporter permease [Nocardiopsaceae bacterium]|nr:ABC transporter permease [Nocardiopsaceae bacterium]
MTRVAQPRRAAAPVGRHSARAAPGAGLGHLLTSEWTKIRSVRSTLWTLILLVVVTVGFTALLSLAVASSWDQARPGQRAATAADPVATILGTGITFGQLLVCVLGVLIVSSEYSTGAIRASLMAVPRRFPMLAAKALVFAVIMFVAGEVTAFGSFFAGSAILHSHAPVALSDPGVTRSVLGAGLYLTVLGLFAMAIGAILRHTAGAISTAIGVVFVLPIIAQFLPGSWGQHIHDYLPSAAGQMITQAHQSANQVLTPWQGFAVLCGWTAVLLAVAFYFLQRRDA